MAVTVAAVRGASAATRAVAPGFFVIMIAVIMATCIVTAAAPAGSTRAAGLVAVSVILFAVTVIVAARSARALAP